MDYLFPDLGYHMEDVYSHYGFKRINIHNCWFQQYEKGSGHMWHIHMDCQWTNVCERSDVRVVPMPGRVFPWPGRVVPWPGRVVPWL